MLERMFNKDNYLPLFVGVQSSTTTININRLISFEVGNKTISRPSYDTKGHIT